MADIRYAASKLIDLAGASDPSRIAFIAGGGAFLEALKITRRHTDTWTAEACPVVDPAKAYTLLSIPLAHIAELPVNALCILLDGKPCMNAIVELSSGCASGIQPPPPPKPVEPVAQPEPPAKRSVFSRRGSKK